MSCKKCAKSENNLQLRNMVVIAPCSHICPVSAIFSSSSTFMSLGHISLLWENRNHSSVQEGETASSLTQTCCYKSTLFWGCVGGTPTLTPSFPQCIWPANQLTDALNSNTHQTQTQALLTHLGGQERKHANRAGLSASTPVNVEERRGHDHFPNKEFVHGANTRSDIFTRARARTQIPAMVHFQTLV